jgi:hypothetical protein
VALVVTAAFRPGRWQAAADWRTRAGLCRHHLDVDLQRHFPNAVKKALGF